jgi:hypothetical protein
MLKKNSYLILLTFLISCKSNIQVIEYTSNKYGQAITGETLNMFKREDITQTKTISDRDVLNEFYHIKNEIEKRGQDDFLKTMIYLYAFTNKKDTIYTVALKSKDSTEYDRYIKIWKYKGKTLRYSSDIITVETVKN